MRPKYHSEIIERYEGVAQGRNLENTKLTSARKTSIIPGGAPPLRPTVKKKKTESKGVPLESIINIIYANMSDEGIRKMFDQCSDDFFIAVEDELGEIRKGRFLIHPSFT